MDRTPPAISVLLPVYDATATLAEALGDLRAQTFADLEIVVVDDGSTDGSATLLDAVARDEPRLRVLHRPHRGLVPSLIEGLAACRGRLVARMDADDRCAPTRLANQHRALEEHPDLALVSCLVDGATCGGGPLPGGMQRYLDWSNALVEHEAIVAQRFVESPLVHPTILARREALLAVGGYRETGWAEDYDLWLRLLHAGMRVAKLPEVLVTWRDSPGRATRTDRRYASERLRACKLHHLLAGPLAGRRRVVCWGAGLEGKPWLRALRSQGVEVPAVVELHPGRLGQRIHGARGVPPDALRRELDDLGEAPLVLAAVGVPAARQQIRDFCTPLGLREGETLWFLA